MLRRRWLLRSAGLFVLILLVLNVYVFLTREWESSFSPTSYATLYCPLDVPTIRAWHVVDRDRIGLELVCSAPVKEWRVVSADGKEQRAEGTNPAFRIDTTFSILHPYRLIPVPEDACVPVELSFRFYSKEFYGGLGMRHNDVYIVRSSVACGEFPQFSVADWTDNYDYVGKEGLAAADSVLAGAVGLRQGDPTFTKMEKLGRYLRGQLKGSGGVPKDDERWMNPWVLYNEMVRGTGKGWCTQNAQVWVFWANRAGIPTRFVFNARTENNTIVYTGHAFAESFIREQGRWAFVDLSQGTLYVTDRQGRVLNTAELFHLNIQNAFDSVSARVNVDWQWRGRPGFPATDTVTTLPFILCNAAVREEFTPHSILKYRRPPNVEDVRDIYDGFIKDRTFLVGNLERYLFKPQLAYSLYPTEGEHTYFVRRALFFTLVAGVLLWLFAFLVRGREPGVDR
jgi:hypothetical protein